MKDSSKIGICLGIGAGAIGAVVAAPVILAAAGFTSAGVAAGSLAAGWMSASGPIVAGSLFASLQSAGAAGLGAAGFSAVAAGGAAVGGATAVGAVAVAEMKGKKSYEKDPVMPLPILPSGDGVVTFCSSNSVRRPERSAKNSYKKRADELAQFFKDLPSSEFLIADYSCELDRNVTIGGRIYLTPNFCCFYSNALRWNIAIMIRYGEIIDLKQERSSSVYGDVVQITTESEKYLFFALATQDKSFDILNLLWERSLRGEVPSLNEMLPLIEDIYEEKF